MWAMIVKEFRQVRRDRRTLAMMIVMPVILLIVFGYAASFDVSTIPTAIAGPEAAAMVLRAPFDVVERAPAEGTSWAQTQLRDGKAAVAVVTGARTKVLIDGSQLFTARAALAALASLASTEKQAGTTTAAGTAPQVTVLYNPGLTTADIMIPGLAGVILVFVGTMITSLGVVRERQTGTLEQLAVMPLRPRDVFLGKVAPYFAVATVDLAIVIAAGVAIFGVPFRGSLAVFALGAVLFLFVTLGLGVLISSVSENQGQAIQLSFMITLPQVLLSGLIFPLSSIAIGVRWISYLLPLTYFNEISRGVMLRAEPIGSLWQPFVFLALLGVVVVTLATLRFRTYLAPATPSRRRDTPASPGGPASAPGADTATATATATATTATAGATATGTTATAGTARATGSTATGTGTAGSGEAQ
jgi:ABC-2 type transport system permease protein